MLFSPLMKENFRWESLFALDCQQDSLSLLIQGVDGLADARLLSEHFSAMADGKLRTFRCSYVRQDVG